MKLLFQIIMSFCMLAIFFDITSCSHERIPSPAIHIKGRLIDAVSKTPVCGLEIAIESSGGVVRQAVADHTGQFALQVPDPENHNYQITLCDVGYRIVNPHTRIVPCGGSQTWYLVPVDPEE